MLDYVTSLTIFSLMLSSIYGVHDEAKDKEFELEMSWVCDESNRQHQKVSLSFNCSENAYKFLWNFVTLNHLTVSPVFISLNNPVVWAYIFHLPWFWS